MKVASTMKHPSFFLRLRHWFFRSLAKETAILKEARDWHLGTNRHACLFCSKLIPLESMFCLFCGTSQDKQTTGHQLRLIREELDRKEADLSFTGQMEAFYLPGDRRFDTYRRMLKENQTRGWS